MSRAIPQLNQRSSEVLRQIIDAYLETGEAVGSRTLSRNLGMELSPATIRNVMADLQDSGLLFSPHASAGRIPTEAGLRLFVDGLLEVGH
ncbi:MAG: heat-inducible transcriptional repressor HrcA, partial [Alphaproteobacteria bacterium]